MPLWFCLPLSSVGWYVNTATTGGANSYWNPLKSPTGSNLAPWRPLALYIQSDRFVNFTPFIQQQGHQYKCMTGKYAPKQWRMNFFTFPFPPLTEATLIPHQEQREGTLHVHPGWSGGDEVRTSGGGWRGGAHEWCLVLSRRPHQEQGNSRWRDLNVLAASGLNHLNSTGVV